MADLTALIARGKIDAIYFLTGERHPVEAVVSALRGAILKGDEEDPFTFELHTVPESGAADILGAANTVPMLGGQRLVLVRDAHLLKGGDLEQLATYAKDPNPTTCLVLVGDKVDGRIKAYARLKKLGLLHRFEAIKERQAAGWVQGEARGMKIPLAAGAAQ